MNICKGGHLGTFRVECISLSFQRRESIHKGVVARRDAGQRNGPEVPVASQALGAKALDRVVREWGLEPGIGVAVAEAGMTRFKRWPWRKGLREGQGCWRRGGKEPRPEDLKSSRNRDRDSHTDGWDSEPGAGTLRK